MTKPDSAKPRIDFDPTVRPPSQMRRNKQDRAREDEWIQDFLQSAQACTVSTTWDDIPFNNPTLFFYDPNAHQVIFHSNIMGRVRANIDRNPKICISCQKMGRLLPSNAALEFSVQYRSVVIFGEAYVIEDMAQARAALYQLIQKYFPKMQAGEHYRPITDDEMRQTSVYAVKIKEWSGKENMKDKAIQTDDWQPLSDHIFNGGFAE